MSSLQAKYALEREGVETLEQAYGFCTYKISGEECYIIDIYVEPDHRKTSLASDMANVVTEIARDRGCTYLLGSVAPQANSATASLKVLLAYGFELAKAEPNAIWFTKGINNG